MSMEEVFEWQDLSNAGMNAGELRTNLYNVLSGLQANPDNPVFVNLRNKPTAVLLDLAAYREMKEEAFAYRLLQIAEEAEHQETLTLEEAKADILQARAARRARLAGEQAEAA